MVNRVLLNANRIAISRPGYDVLFSPINATTMAFDTSFTGMERPLHSGVLRNATIRSQPTVNYPTTYALPPHVLISRRKTATGQLYESTGRAFNVAKDWQNPYTLDLGTNYFRIFMPPAIWPDPDWDIPFDWAYIVMAAGPDV